MKLTEEQKNELSSIADGLKIGLLLDKEGIIVDEFIRLAKLLIKIPETKKIIMDKIFETFGC